MCSRGRGRCSRTRTPELCGGIVSRRLRVNTRKSGRLGLVVFYGHGECQGVLSFFFRFILHRTRWTPVFTSYGSGWTICLWPWRIIPPVSRLPLACISILYQESISPIIVSCLQSCLMSRTDVLSGVCQPPESTRCLLGINAGVHPGRPRGMRHHLPHT